MKIIRIAFFLILTLSLTDVMGQKVVFEGQYLQFGFGSEYGRLFDNSVSSMHYKGINAAATLAYINNKPNSRWWVNLDFDAGFFNSYNFPSYEDRAVEHMSGGYNIGYNRPIHKFSNKLYLWGGLSVTGSYAYNDFLYLSNSSSNYTFLNNFGVNTMLHYTFNMFDRWMSLEWFISIPLATYYMRPGYSVNFPENKIGDHGFATFNQFYEIDSSVKLVYPFMNENKIALEYRWNYYSLNTMNKVQYGTHGVFLTAYFKLNK